MEAKKLFTELLNKHALGMHVAVDLPPVLNLEGRLFHAPLKIVDQNDAKLIAFQLMDEKHKLVFAKYNAVSFTYNAEELGRYRVSVFRQRGAIGVVIRAIPEKLLSIPELNLPPHLEKLADLHRGLVLITGPTGCGKTTTLAAIVNLVNERKRAHIITLEDPIEYLYEHKKCIISQREIGEDTDSFAIALKEALRQDPDVILVGDMREKETISIALTAAETGHLVFGTMHTIDAVQSIDRLIDAFPSNQQHQIRTQLAITLQAVIAQQLVYRANGQGRVPVTEIMMVTSAIRNLIRDGRTHQIYSMLETGSELGMQSFDQCLHKLQQDKVISDAEAISQAVQPYKLIKKISNTSTPFIPRDNQEVRFFDTGLETMPVDRKVVIYKADFALGHEGYWTSSGTVVFNDEGLLCQKNAMNPAPRLYASDFNIVSNRIKPFPLNKHVLIKYKVSVSEAFKTVPLEEKVLYFKVYSPPIKDKPTAYEKIILKMPLDIEDKWHSILIDIPPIYQGKIVKIYMLDFPNALKSFSVNDVVFF